MQLKDKLELPFVLIELCKYQQRIIDTYRNYIETNIHKAIKEEIIDKQLIDMDGWGHYKKVTIPQVTFMVNCSEDILREWELIKNESPLIDLNFFVSIAIKQQEELRNQCQN